jgi:hypothetical protein
MSSSLRLLIICSPQLGAEKLVGNVSGQILVRIKELPNPNIICHSPFGCEQAVEIKGEQIELYGCRFDSK